MSVVTIRIPTPLRTLTGGADEVSVEGTTVGEVLRELVTRHQGLSRYLFNGDGELREFINIYVDDRNVSSLDGLDSAVEPATVFVWDSDRGYRLSLKGLEAIDTIESECDISMAGESLMYCLHFGWGGETLRVNGRYREYPGSHDRIPWNTYPNRFFNYFRLPKMLTQGMEVSARFGGSRIRRSF